MKLSPLRKKEKECLLALDIGTEAVKALIFEKDENYSILSSSLQYFDQSRPFDNNKVILNAREEAVSLAGRSPAGLFAGFSSDILRSRVMNFSISRQKSDSLISVQEAESITKLALKESEKGISESSSKYSGILPQEIKFIDNTILEVKIDGYEVPIISGYSGKNLEFKVLVSFLPKGYLDDFNNIFDSPGLRFKKIINPIKNLIIFPKATDGIFIDIGGEVTQICLIRNGRISMIDEFDIGGKDFSNVFSEILGMSSREARFFKERYSKGDLTNEARQRIKEMLEPSFKKWKSRLRSKLKSATGLLPSIFFLFGGASQLSGIEELLAEDEKEVKFVYPQDFSAKGGFASGRKNIINNVDSINSLQFTNLVLLLHG